MTSTEGDSMFNDPQACWDSDDRRSPYSTVADPSDESYCEEHDADFADCPCGDGTYAGSPLRATHAMCGTDSGVLEAHTQATRSEPRTSLGLVAYCPKCEVGFKPEAVQPRLA